jgi:hypothetical protein
MIHFRVVIPLATFTLLLFETLLVVACFVFAVAFMLQIDPAVYLLDDGGMISIAFVLISILAGLYFQGTYFDLSPKPRMKLLSQIGFAIGAALMVLGLVGSVFRSVRLPAHVAAVGSLLSMAATFLWRVAFSALVLPLLRDDALILGVVQREQPLGVKPEMN